jgi:hypothetical protein
MNDKLLRNQQHFAPDLSDPVFSSFQALGETFQQK